MKKSLKFHLKKGGSRRRGSRRRGSRRKSMHRRSSHRRRRTMRGGAALSPIQRSLEENAAARRNLKEQQKRASAEQKLAVRAEKKAESQRRAEEKKAETQRRAEERKAETQRRAEGRKQIKQSARSQLAQREAICIQQCKDRYRPRRRTPGAERARARTF